MFQQPIEKKANFTDVLQALNKLSIKQLEHYKSQNLNNLPQEISSLKELISTAWESINAQDGSSNPTKAANLLLDNLPEKLDLYFGDFSKKLELIANIYSNAGLPGILDERHLAELDSAIPTKKNLILQSQLQSQCEAYLDHLDKKLNKLSKMLPQDVRNTYISNNSDNIDPDKLLQQAIPYKRLGLLSGYNNQTFYDYDSQNNKSSKELYPELHVTLEKYRAVKSLKEHLDNKSISYKDRIANFKGEIDKPETKAVISKHSDTAGKRFLSIIGNILTLGLVSKYRKGTFDFWKSHGDVAIEKMQTTIASPKKSR